MKLLLLNGSPHENGCTATALREVGRTLEALGTGSLPTQWVSVSMPSASGQVISFLDRLFFASGGRWAGKVAAAVVSCRRGGASTAFQQLNLFFGMNNLVVATSQYWNQVHGNTPQEVAQDLEGLQTMRTLARNLAWILRCREAAALPAPEREPVTPTNFIR